MAPPWAMAEAPSGRRFAISGSPPVIVEITVCRRAVTVAPRKQANFAGRLSASSRRWRRRHAYRVTRRAGPVSRIDRLRTRAIGRRRENTHAGSATRAFEIIDAQTTATGLGACVFRPSLALRLCCQIATSLVTSNARRRASQPVVICPYAHRRVVGRARLRLRGGLKLRHLRYRQIAWHSRASSSSLFWPTIIGADSPFSPQGAGIAAYDDIRVLPFRARTATKMQMPPPPVKRGQITEALGSRRRGHGAPRMTESRRHGTLARRRLFWRALRPLEH